MSDPSNRCKAKPKGSSLGGPKPASKPSPASLKPPVVAPKLSKERFRKFDYTISKHEGPIEIFKAPSHRAYMVTAQSISALCVLYVGFELLVARKDRQSQAQNWHNVVFGTSCLVMSWIGVIFLRKGTNLISRITATHSNGQTLLRIRVRSLIPFRKREIVATPFEMSLSRSPVVDPAREIDERSMRIFERLAEQRAIAEMPFYKAPGKKFSLGMWQILMNVRGTFTQEHFVFLEVNKKGTLRLDITGKFAPDVQDGESERERDIDLLEPNRHRRYGEPESKHRIKICLERGDVAFGKLTPRGVDQSFEEWVLETIKTYSMEVSPSDDVRRSNPLSILCGGVDMIEVVVGGDPANTWRLHENLLCAASSYFKAAVSSRFSEGLNKKVSLPMDDNVIFMLFVEWLYTRNFRVNNMRTLFHAYVLGDRLGAPGFTSRVLDNIYDGIQWYEVKPDEVIWVIENTMAASALQRLLIDTVAFKVLTGSLATFSSAEWEALAPVQNEILQSASKLSQWNVLQHQPRPMSRPPRTEYTDHHTIEQEYAHRPAIGEKHPDRPAIEAESRELDLEGPAPIFG